MIVIFNVLEGRTNDGINNFLNRCVRCSFLNAYK